MENGKRKVVVTTKDRGVFFGTLEKRVDATTVVLSDIRMCVYWSKETQGVVSLANTGPMPGSRVSKAAPNGEVLGVNLVLSCTDKSAEVWESEPWS